MSATGLPDDARRLLSLARPAVLTTINADGTPHSTPVWAMADGDDVIMSTLTKRLKYRNTARDPRVSLVLLDPADPLHYVSINGEVRLEPDPAKVVLDALSVKYLGGPYPIDEGAANVRVTLRLHVDRVAGQIEAAR